MKGQKTIKMEFTKRNSEQGEGRVRSENCSEAEELQLLEKKYLQILYQTSCKPEIVIVGFNLWSCWLSFTRVRFSFGQKIPLKEPREVGNYGARWKQAWCEPHGAWSHLWEFTASTAAAPVGSRSTDREISTSKPAQTRALHPHPMAKGFGTIEFPAHPKIALLGFKGHWDELQQLQISFRSYSRWKRWNSIQGTPNQQESWDDRAQQGEVLPWMCSWEFHSELFSPENTTHKSEFYPPVALIVSWSFWSDMSNTLLTSSLANLLFAFFLKFIVLLNQSLGKSSFLPVILAAASLPVCYLQGTAVLGTAPSSCWGILTLLWESCLFPAQQSQNCPF